MVDNFKDTGKVEIPQEIAKELPSVNFSVDETADSSKGQMGQQLTDEEIAAEIVRLAWGLNFPNTTQLSSIASLKAHKDYVAAKAGDVEAAFNIIYDLFNASLNASPAQKTQIKKRIDKIKELKEKHTNAVLVSVHAVEAAGKNQISQQLAIYRR